MLQWSRWLRAAAGCTAWFVSAASAPPAAAIPQDFSGARASTQARRVVDWVLKTQDAGGRPFAVVDKRKAHIYIFDARGRLAGHSPVLLGSTVGDHTVPGVGERAQTGHVPPDQRTTPSGRFEAVPGHNVTGEHVVWVDYGSAFAIHRLRPGFSYQARSTRLAAGEPLGKRVSWGCVVVPVDFYAMVVERVLGSTRSVVYVMPETAPLRSLFQTNQL